MRYLFALIALVALTANAQQSTLGPKAVGGAPSGYVTPQMYGAVGDGVTDDSAALKAWLFYGCSSNWVCYLPARRQAGVMRVRLRC
jgi:hypothetical protein